MQAIVCENCGQRSAYYNMVANVRLCEKCYGEHKPGIAWMIREYLAFVKNYHNRPKLVVKSGTDTEDWIAEEAESK